MPIQRMRQLVAELCSDACAGRAAGSPGGALARGQVIDALRDAGLDPYAQDVPACGGANVIATLPGDVDRWVVVAAHYDHLGREGRDIYRGADDNAAAVAILVEVARALAADRPDGRGIVLAAFDAEEPPHFMSGSMGSQHYVRHPVVPLDATDMMVCMDLCGHELGAAVAPREVRSSLFLLGAERSDGTPELVDGIDEPGITTRRIDAEVIPPLSDYDAFWRRQIPFVFLTNGRWRYYHTPEDTPDKLAYHKMGATARWLERYVRATCARDAPIRFRQRHDDAATLRSAVSLCESLAEISSEADMGRDMALRLLAACDASGQLPEARRAEVQMLVGLLESRLA